jgi:hypothetical protein
MDVRNIRVVIVELTPRAIDDRPLNRNRLSDRLNNEDPFIRGLIHKLQREVRHQRQRGFESPLPKHSRWSALQTEAPRPNTAGSTEFEPFDWDEVWPVERDSDSDDQPRA